MAAALEAVHRVTTPLLRRLEDGTKLMRNAATDLEKKIPGLVWLKCSSSAVSVVGLAGARTRCVGRVVGGILNHIRFDSYWRWSYGGVVFCIF